MKKMLSLFIVLSCLMLSGCSSSPTYKTETEIQDFIKTSFGNNIELIGEKEVDLEEVNKNIWFVETDDTKYLSEDDEPIKYIEYTYYDNDYNFEFKAYNYSDYRSASKGGGSWNKKLVITYNTELYNSKKNQIESILQKNEVEYRIDIDLFYNLNFIAFDRYDFIAIAKSIKEIDDLVNFRYDKTLAEDAYKNDFYNLKYMFNVYLKPSIGETNLLTNEEYLWEYEYQYKTKILEKEFTITEEDYYLENDLIYELNSSVANHIKFEENQLYTMDSEELYNYPASKLKLESVNDIQFIVSKYDYISGANWDDRNINLNFSDNEYTSESFKLLAKDSYYSEPFIDVIKYLGGDYEIIDENQSRWIIDSNVWEVNDLIDTNEIKVTHNNESIIIDDDMITIEELEFLFNANIILNQRNLSFSIEKK